MVTATKAELRAMGIPFFVVRDSFVERSDTNVAVPISDGAKGSTRLSEKELRVLQKRILELLEDLCRE